MQGFAPRRIVVPVNASATDEEAVTLACRLARRDKAKVRVVTILEVKRALALATVDDAKVTQAEQLLDHAEEIGRELDLAVETDLLQAREAGPAIVDLTDEWKADLVVLGLPYRERFGEFSMGKTASHVLQRARCRVLVFREPRT